MPAERSSPGGRLLLEEDGSALVLRISNPGRANALDEAILDALASLLHAPPPAARAVLLGGDGDRHFSAGLDLGGEGGDPVERVRSGERRLGAAVAAVADCPIPVIGVVNGAAAGGALELAIACDWRIAGAGVRLAMPATRFGVVYTADGLRRFVAAMGPGRTRRMFLTGAPIEADEALAIGLVDQVVEPEELTEAVEDLAMTFAENAPLTLKATKQIIERLTGPPSDVRRGADWYREIFRSRDFQEGLDAFFAKRKPEFHGE
jgi:enoyl-CoA hydratase/carnithine racemase